MDINEQHRSKERRQSHDTSPFKLVYFSVDLGKQIICSLLISHLSLNIIKKKIF